MPKPKTIRPIWHQHDDWVFQNPGPLTEIIREIAEHDLVHQIMGEIQLLQHYGVDVRDPDLLRRIIKHAEMMPKAEAMPLEPNPYRPQVKPHPLMELRSNHDPVVYYMRLGNMVKIGTSRNLSTRFETIGAQEVLAVESGAHDLERLRHIQFGKLRSHGEWFRYEDPLTQFIATL